MDLHSKKILGYAYTTSMTAALTVKTVDNTCLNVKSTEEIILHSDLGVQYTSQKFEACMKANHMIHSFSRNGNPYVNACIESFHSLLNGKK